VIEATSIVQWPINPLATGVHGVESAEASATELSGAESPAGRESCAAEESEPLGGTGASAASPGIAAPSPEGLAPSPDVRPLVETRRLHALGAASMTTRKAKRRRE